MRASAAGVRQTSSYYFSDDQQADTIHAWGNEQIETPNLDRLTAEGFSFRNKLLHGRRDRRGLHSEPEIDLTGRERSPDAWQPMWIVEKYFPDWF